MNQNMTQNKNRYHATAAKDTLARLLATENLQVRRDKRLKTASMDTVNRILYLPVWDEKNLSQTVQDALIGHEVGHALYTPAEGLAQFAEKLVPAYYKANKSKICYIANCLEDSRIERLMKKRFPGLARVMSEGYTELWNDDFFGVKGRKIGELTFLDRINLHCKMGASAMVPFHTPKEIELLRKVESTETVEDVIRVAREIIEYLPKKKNPKQNQQDKPKEEENPEETDETEESNSEGSGSEDENEDNSESNDSSENNSEEEDNESSSSESSENDEEEEESSDESSEDSGEGDSQGDDDSSETSENDSKGGQESDELNDSSAPEEEEQSEESSDSEGTGEEKPSEETSSEKDEETTKTTTNQGIPSKETAEEISDEGEEEELLGETLDNLQQALEDSTQTSQNTATTGFVYLDMPSNSYDLATIIRPFKDCLSLLEYGWSVSLVNSATLRENTSIVSTEYQTFYKSQLPIINQMVSDFEARKAATEHVRSEETKTGTLDMNRLHQASFNDDIFQKLTTIPQGKNHGLVMFIDWSGSMNTQLSNTVNQLLNLVWFCRKLNIPFDVYAFGNGNYAPKNHDQQSIRPETEILINDLTLTNMLSSKAPKAQLDRAMFLLWFAAKNQSTMGICGSGWTITNQFDAATIAQAGVIAKGTLHLTGTPLFQTLAIMPNVVSAFQRINKVEIVHAVVLSDGDPTDMLSSKTLINAQPADEIILRDPLTYTEINLGQNRMANFATRMAAMIRLTRIRIKGCNVIGFFIMAHYDSSIFRGRRNQQAMLYNEMISLKQKGLDDKAALKAAEELNAEGFTTIKDTLGYSEYYIIYSTALKVNSSSHMNITSDANKRKMAAQFAEHVTKHKASRVFLGRFVRQVVAHGVI